MKKRTHKKKPTLELTKETEELEEKVNIEDLPITVDVKGIRYVREDYNESPKEVTEKFLQKKEKFNWKKPKTYLTAIQGSKPYEPKGNLALVLDNEGNLIIYDNVKSGIFKIRKNEGTDREYDDYIILRPNKIRNIRWWDYNQKEEKLEEENWKAWVLDINSATALPTEPQYDTEQVGQLVRKVATDRKALDDGLKKKLWKNWLWYVAIGLIVIYIIWLAWSKYGIAELVTGAIPVAKNTATSVTGGTLT